MEADELRAGSWGPRPARERVGTEGGASLTFTPVCIFCFVDFDSDVYYFGSFDSI